MRPVTPYKWIFLAAVYDQTNQTVTLYAGNTPGITKTGANLGAGFTVLDIGRNPQYANYFSGLIDNVFVFPEALTPEQVAYIRDSGERSLRTAIRTKAVSPVMLLLLSD